MNDSKGKRPCEKEMRDQGERGVIESRGRDSSELHDRRL